MQHLTANEHVLNKLQLPLSGYLAVIANDLLISLFPLFLLVFVIKEVYLGPIDTPVKGTPI